MGFWGFAYFAMLDTASDGSYSGRSASDWCPTPCSTVHRPPSSPRASLPACDTARQGLKVAELVERIATEDGLTAVDIADVLLLD